MSRTHDRRPMRRPGRSPGTVNLLVSVTVLALLLPALLNAGSVPPPTAAEFAPSADQVIEEAPTDQGAAVTGTGEGPAEAGPTESEAPSEEPTPEPSPTETLVVGENEVKQCVGPPPLRQIEDPQSPPCVAFWTGDNGGATAKGVTREAIYIAIPTPEAIEAQYEALRNFFNKRFQFYGRELVFQYCASSGGGTGSSDEANQVADAALAASGCGGGPEPFASQFYRTGNGPYYMRAMGCKHQTIAVGVYAPYDSTFLNQCAPYLYQYSMEVDEEFANFGEWGCKRLVGRNAVYADGNDSSIPPRALNSLPRKFGVLLEPFTDDDPVARRDALDPMVDRLRACGGDVAEEDIIITPVSGSFDPSSAQNAMLQLRDHDVTSVICMCNFFSFGTLQRAAEAVQYRPEWITGTFGLNDVDSSFFLGQGPKTQMVRTFGLTFNPRTIDPLLNPYNAALQEGDPSQAPQTNAAVEGRLEVYRGLLVLASGIQMAGPNLTPETFRDGLRKAQFPNPTTPLMAGAIDIKSDGYSFTADGAEWWWSTTATGPFSDSSTNPGTVCYLNGGQRHVLGQWPTGDAPFFQGECNAS